jgi:2-hydroxychromene-2-carboxylate isomerase
MAKRPAVYFSFRSPYSWMALHRLCRVVPGVFDAVELVPYWDPDTGTERALKERDAGSHYAQMSKAKHLYILHDTKRLSARLGLPMAWPVDVDPWWEVPHLAWLLARREGRASECYVAFSAARWNRGENICDQAVVRRLGAEIGVDGDRLAAAVDDPDVRAESVECLVRAYDDDVFGVPYFRLGRHRLWGYDRVDDYVELLLPALRGEPAGAGEAAGLHGVPVAVIDPVGGYDTDTAGGCG